MEVRRLNVTNVTQDFQDVENTTSLVFTLSRDNFDVSELTTYE